MHDGAWFETLLESAPDAIVVAERSGRIVLVNRRVEELFGYSREELLGQQVDVLVPEPLRARHVGHRAAFAAEPTTRPMGTGLALLACRRDGSELPVEISLSPITANGKSLVLAIVRDVSERAAADEELRHAYAELARASTAKDRFLATMSHELRTPLNAIIGYTGTLLMGLAGDLNEEQVRQVGSVQASGKHLLSLINDLLDLAKIESGRVALASQAVDCHEIVAAVVSTLRSAAADKGISLESALPETPPKLVTDSRVLTQILLNLTSNAVNLTDAGRVVVALGERTNGRRSVVFSVKDSSAGLDEAELGQIFGPFERIGEPGTAGYRRLGLGLHVSRKLAELLGGSLEITSEDGEGTIWRLELNGGD